MIVRELVTLLRYDADMSGADRFENRLHGLMDTLKGLAAMAGLAFGLHELMEFSDEWNTIKGRVSNVVDGIQEQHRVMAALQQQAENTGQSFEGIGGLFTQLATSGKGLGLTTDNVLELTSAISKMVTLGGGSAAGGRRGMIQIEEMFALDKVQMNHLKALMIDIPGAVDIISAGLGGKKRFMEMVHSGQVTGKMFAKAFLDASGEIDKRFARMPMTFSRAFGEVRNMVGGFLFDVGEASHVFTGMAETIVKGGRWIIDTLRAMASYVGGYSNELKLVGIIAAAIYGPAALSGLAALARTLGLLSVTTLPWLLTLVAIGLALDDIYSWYSGNGSVLEDFIGPIGQWLPQIEAAKKWFADLWRDIKTGADALDFSSVKKAWNSILGQDPLGDFKRDADAMKQSFTDANNIAHLLGIAITGLGDPDKWTVFGQIQAFIDDIAMLLKSVGQAKEVLNGERSAGEFFHTEQFGPPAPGRTTVGPDITLGDQLDPMKAGTALGQWLRQQMGLENHPVNVLGAIRGMDPNMMFGVLGGAGPIGGVTPGSMVPVSRTTTITNTQNAPVSVTVTVPPGSDAAGIGAAAGDAVQRALPPPSEFSRGMENASPSVEFGGRH